MSDTFTKKASLLTYLGILPFILSTLAIILDFESDRAYFILGSYGAIIASFIAGIHWGIAMQQQLSKVIWLLTSSNAIALITWGSLLMYNKFFSLLTLTVSLLMLLLIDTKLYKAKYIALWFLKLRKLASIIVVACLVAAMVKLI